jgi:hypothetical protein
MSLIPVSTKKYVAGWALSILLLFSLAVSGDVLQTTDWTSGRCAHHLPFLVVPGEVHRPIESNISRSCWSQVKGLGSFMSPGVKRALNPFILGIHRCFKEPGFFPSVARQVCRSSFQSWTIKHAVQVLQVPQHQSEVLYFARGGSQVKTKKRPSKSKSSSFKGSKKKSQSQYDASLSSPQPFLSKDDIGELTLTDVSLAFDYAVKSTREDFDESSFLNGIIPRVRATFEAMDQAAAKSRGKDTKPAITAVGDSVRKTTGDIDVFNFCAAMRILSEWRILRQVPPEGYKGYAVGMNLGHKDVVNNIGKIESAAHSLIDHRKEAASSSVKASPPGLIDISSPTLRDVLQFEVDMDVHPNSKLPKLKEQSGAMGLLWVRRQLHFQTAIFERLLQVPQKFPSSSEAVAAAYGEVLSKFHGFAIKTVFNCSFKDAPAIEEIYKIMNPHHLKEVIDSANQGLSQPSKEKGELNKPENIVERIGWEFVKINKCLYKHLEDRYDAVQLQLRRLRGGEDSEGDLQAEGLEEFVVDEMRKDAHEHIASYLEIAQPILNDLAELFREFNMDDPKKV